VPSSYLIAPQYSTQQNQKPNQRFQRNPQKRQIFVVTFAETAPA